MNEYGITKLMDGIFIADQSIMIDFEFLISNKVSHVVIWGQPINQQLLDQKNIKVFFHYKKYNEESMPNFIELQKLYHFIEQAKDECLCCLVCSNIQSEAALMFAPYLMQRQTVKFKVSRFGWDLKTILDFFHFLCNFFNPRVELVEQLMDFKDYLQKKSLKPLKSIRFNFSLLSNIKSDDTDELILLNTIKNTLQEQKNYPQQKKIYNKRRKRVQWFDRVRNSSSLSSFNLTASTNFSMVPQSNKNKFVVYNLYSNLKARNHKIQEKISSSLKTYDISFKSQKKHQKMKRISQFSNFNPMNNLNMASSTTPNNGNQFIVDDIEFQSLKQLSRTKIFKGSLKKRGSLKLVAKPNENKQQAFKQNNYQSRVSSAKKMVTQFKSTVKSDNVFTNLKIMSRVKMSQVSLNA